MDRRITFFVQGISLIYLVTWTSICKAQVASPDESRRWSESQAGQLNPTIMHLIRQPRSWDRFWRKSHSISCLTEQYVT